MHVPHPGQIVRVFGTTAQDHEGAFTYSEYQSMAKRLTAFEGPGAGLIAIGGRGSMMPRPDGTSTLLGTDVVSTNFFTVMGVHPLLGRMFTAGDAKWLRIHPAVVLGYSCWQRDFGGDPNIVGRQIPLRHGEDRVNQVDVWGVLPPTFREIDPNSDNDLWMPAETWADIVDPTELTSKDFRWFNLLGRLAPDATVRQANDQAKTVAGALAAADPADNHGRSARAISDFSYRMSQAGTSGLLLFVIVGGVVLLAIVNVAHLLFSRALVRAPEVALRLSLGATPSAIARQLLIENLLLGILSLAAGLTLAAGLAALLPHLLVLEPVLLESYGSGFRLHVDGRVFLFAALLALVTMLLLAVVPLIQVARAELLPVMQASAVTRTSGRAPIAAPHCYLATDWHLVRAAGLDRHTGTQLPQYAHAIHRSHPQTGADRVHAGTGRPRTRRSYRQLARSARRRERGIRNPRAAHALGGRHCSQSSISQPSRPARSS